MSRQRMIRPEFFTDADLGDLPPATRLLFIGLWTLADREGRLRDKPRDIKRALMPTDDFDPDEALESLVAIGCIRRYEVDDEYYIDIPRFSVYQHVHPKETPSVLPPFKFHRAAKKPSISREALELHGKPGNYTASPSALTSTSTSSKRESSLLKSEESPLSLVEIASNDDFDAMWRPYPNKQGKKDAIRYWLRLSPDDRQRATLASQAMGYAVANGYQQARFCPHGATFLNARRFDDWFDETGAMVAPPNYQISGNGKLQAQVDRLAALAAEMDWEET